MPKKAQKHIVGYSEVPKQIRSLSPIEIHVWCPKILPCELKNLSYSCFKMQCFVYGKTLAIKRSLHH